MPGKEVLLFHDGQPATNSDYSDRLEQHHGERARLAHEFCTYNGQSRHTAQYWDHYLSFLYRKECLVHKLGGCISHAGAPIWFFSWEVLMKVKQARTGELGQVVRRPTEEDPFCQVQLANNTYQWWLPEHFQVCNEDGTFGPMTW